MMNQESKRPVTIEDLLRLKRAEHPSPDFWSEFDRELRAKQLAALVERRPWWRTFPVTLRGLARYHLPLGATAVLAVTLLSIRDYQPVMPGSGTGLSTVDVARSEQAPVPAMVVASASLDPVAASEPIAEPSMSEQATAEVVSSSASAGELARMVPLFGTRAETAEADLRPSMRSIAMNRAAAEAMLGTSSGTSFEARALPIRNVQEPLAQMSSPAETRRSRFAAAFAAAAAGTSPVPTARVASRLSDEQLYDSIHRFGASGNSVSIKF